MEASVVDLRYKTKEVMKALGRRETVTLTYRGKVKGYIVPVREAKPRVKDQEFFGIEKDWTRSVEEEVRALRAGRYDDL